MSMHSLLSTYLNKPQLEAVQYLDGDLLMLAGAGTGKTHALINRILHLIEIGVADSNDVLAITFTNKAVKELKDRLKKVNPENKVTIGTFHSVFNKILRPCADQVGLKSNYTIINDKDAKKALNSVVKEMNIDTKVWPVDDILKSIGNWKNRGGDHSSFPDKKYGGGKGLEVLKRYQNYLLRSNCCDFGDLISHPYTIFSKNPSVLEQYKKRWKYIHIDEYQDNNGAQNKLVELLWGKNQYSKLCAVGDEDQSIYSWRGVDVNHILNFQKIFSKAKIIKLEENYRSTQHIINGARNLISHNKNRIGKKIKSTREKGDKIRLLVFENNYQEAQGICAEIESLKHDGLALNQISILMRTSSQMRVFEDALRYQEIPYRIVGNARFYEKREIRDVLAYLSLLINKADTMAFIRAIQNPKRGVGDRTIELILRESEERNLSLYDFINKFIGDRNSVFSEIRKSSKKGLKEFVIQLNGWIELYEKRDKNLLKIILKESGYIDYLEENEERLNSLKELELIMENFDTVEEFMDHASLMSASYQEEAQDAVSIMTLHTAKGTEYEAVFLPGWEENILPHSRSIKDDLLEEERCLAHVGITRAKNYCYISHVKNRKMASGESHSASPSRFIQEIGKKNLEDYTDIFREKTNFISISQTHSYKRMRIRNIKSNSMKVYHKIFGLGTVISTGQDKLLVRFKNGEMKEIKGDFIKYN